MTANQAGSGMIATVIIPAHNEEVVLPRTLAALADLASRGALDVVVVPNGCTDKTAEVARTFRGVRVVETRRPSKAVALCIGDEESRTFPRIYLDADVTLLPGSVEAMAATLQDSDVLAVRPEIAYDSEGASWPVRSYYRARARAAPVAGHVYGAGCYACSRAGRDRFERFPDEVADDLFFDSRYSPEEIRVVAGALAVQRTPRTVPALLSILRRHQRGNTTFRSGQRAVASTSRTTLQRLVSSTPRTLPGVLDSILYVGLALAARHAWGSPRWARDDSSRRSG